MLNKFINFIKNLWKKPAKIEMAAAPVAIVPQPSTTPDFYPVGLPVSNCIGTDYTYVQHSQYSSLVSRLTKNPVWVAGVVTKESCSGATPRVNDFKNDPLVPVGFGATVADYHLAKSKEGEELAKGHMYDAFDSQLNPQIMEESFQVPTNFVPQNQSNNAGVWKSFEEIIHKLAIEYGKVYVVAGPLYDQDFGTIGHQVKIPSKLYKVIYIPQLNKSLGYIIPNTKLSNTKPEQFTVSQDDVEVATGLKFFTNIKDYDKVKTLNDIGVQEK